MCWVLPSSLCYCGVVVITIARLHSTKPELKFCACSYPAHSMSEIRDGGDLWQWSLLEIRLNNFLQSTIPQKQFIIIFITLSFIGLICAVTICVVYVDTLWLTFPSVLPISHFTDVIWNVLTFPFKVLNVTVSTGPLNPSSAATSLLI